MIEQIKNHMNKCYDYMRSMVVSHDNVQCVALAEMELEMAFRALQELEASMKTEEQKEDADGQTD